MKAYDSYKKSKFQWFDKIPEHWIEGKIKYLFEISRGRVISQLEVKPEAKFPVYSSQTKNDGCLGYIDTFDYEGEMLTWTTDGANAGSVFQRKGQFNCTNVCGILTPTKELGLRYYFYYVDFIAQFYKRPDTNGAKIMSNEMAEIHCFIPSLKEQTKIAAFLDYKTNLIDATIEKKKRLIELLKEKRQAVINEAVTKGLNPNAAMKDSGVEWLGEIPEHWEVTFLKRYCDKITDGAHFSPKTEFEGKNYISVKDVDEFGNIDLLNCKKINIEDFIDLQKNGCQPNFNDVLLTKDGTIGRAAVVKKSNDFVTLSSLGLITPNQNKLNSDFLRYYLVSEININQMFSMIAGAALTRLTIDKIKHLIITIPKYDEQLSIVNFLEKEITKYDTLIKVNDNQIEKLKTYRQSLISEAVTGKIDVREWQITNN